MHFFGFAGRKPIVVHNRRGMRLILVTWRLTRLANYRRMPISPNFNQGVEAARPVSPLNGSYHKVSTNAPFLLDYSGLLPIPRHVNRVSRSRRRDSGVRRFGAKETQPLTYVFEILNNSLRLCFLCIYNSERFVFLSFILLSLVLPHCQSLPSVFKCSCNGF